jgi:hypothetical protein
MDYVTVTRGPRLYQVTLWVHVTLFPTCSSLLACFCTLYDSYMIPYYLPDQFVLTKSKSFGDVEVNDLHGAPRPA